MRRHRARQVSVLIFVAAALIASCAKPYHEENERYVFVATNINLPYWQEAQAGFLDAAKTLGVKARYSGVASASTRLLETLKQRRQSCSRGPFGH
jgi:ABC-type sugar transport system substrate-binding protein